MNHTATDFLLGVLPESERERIAQRIIEDADFCAEVEGAEIDLIDRYARGELSSSDAKRVRDRLIAAPGGEHQLRVARALSLKSPPAKKRWRAVLAAAAMISLAFAAGSLWHNRGAAGDHAAVSQPFPLTIDVAATRGDAHVRQFRMPPNRPLRIVIKAETPIPDGAVAHVQAAGLDRLLPVENQAFTLIAAPPGRYQLEVMLQTKLLAAADFDLVASQSAP